MSRYDLVTSRKYTTSNGEEKTSYHKVGTMFASKNGNGFSLKFDSLPLPNDKGEVWVSAFEQRQDLGKEASEKSQMLTGTKHDDDIPF